MAKTATRRGAAKAAANCDWESIEKDYRAGVLAVREIAKRYSIAESSIRHRAKLHAWERDLSQLVQERVRAQLVRTTEGSEAEIVANAADEVVKVVKLHRRDIASGRGIVEMLFGQLSEAAQKRREIEEEIVEDTKDEKTSERRSRMLRAVSLPAHAVTMRDLAQALRHVVTLERQAYSLDDRPAEEPEQAGELSAKIASKIISDLHDIAAG